MRIAQSIRTVRKERGLTRQQVADGLYVTRQAVSRWECGHTMPDVDTLKKLAALLGADVRMLLGLDDSAVCQSCGMTLAAWEDLGTDAKGALDPEYCAHCMRQGAYGPEKTIEEMVESNLRSLDRFNRENGTRYTPDQARAMLLEYLPTLRRWQK